jgi:hypothetical protein
MDREELVYIKLDLRNGPAWYCGHDDYRSDATQRIAVTLKTANQEIACLRRPERELVVLIPANQE